MAKKKTVAQLEKEMEALKSEQKLLKSINGIEKSFLRLKLFLVDIDSKSNELWDHINDLITPMMLSGQVPENSLKPDGVKDKKAGS